MKLLCFYFQLRKRPFQVMNIEGIDLILLHQVEAIPFRKPGI